MTLYIRFCLLSGKCQGEAGALARLCVDINGSAVLLHQLMNQESPVPRFSPLEETPFRKYDRAAVAVCRAGVLAGDDVDVWAAVDADVDLARAFRMR